MFCSNCGTKNDDDAMFCANCGQKLEVFPAPAKMAPVSEVQTPEPAVTAEIPAQTVEIPVQTVEIPAQTVEVPAQTVEIPAQAVEVPAQTAEIPAQFSETPAPALNPAPEPATVPSPDSEPVSAPSTAAPEAPVIETPGASDVTPSVNTDKITADTDPAEPKKEGKKVKPLIFIIIGAAVLLIILIVIIAVAVSSSSGNKDTTDADFDRYYVDDDEATYFILNGKEAKDSVPGCAYVCGFSSEFSVIAVYNDDDEYFLVTNKGVTELGEDFNSLAVSFDGSVVGYIDEDDVLYSYNVKSGKTTSIAEDVEEFVISPKGKSFAYVVEDGDDYILYAFNGNKEIELGDDNYPVGLTDDCKYIYYYNNDKDALYVTNMKDDSNKIASDIYGDYLFNKDCTELMFTCDKGTFITKKGEDKIKISSSTDYTPLEYYVGLNYSYSSSSLICSFKSFSDHYFYIDEDIVYLDKKFESEKIVSGVYTSLSVNDNIDTVYYINSSDTLYSCRLTGKTEPEKIKSDIESAKCVPGGKGVYFVNDEDSLYYKGGVKDPEKIADDVDSFDVTYDGICLFMTDYDYEDETGMLYYSKNGGDKTKIESDCFDFSCDGNYTIYLNNYDYDSDDYTCTYDVNIATSGVKFNTIIESAGY